HPPPERRRQLAQPAYCFRTAPMILAVANQLHALRAQNGGGLHEMQVIIWPCLVIDANDLHIPDAQPSVFQNWWQRTAQFRQLPFAIGRSIAVAGDSRRSTRSNPA